MCEASCFVQSAVRMCAQYSAASFVETINAGSLTMEPDEFLARMLSAGVANLPSAPPPASTPAAALTAAAPGSGPGHAAAAIADHVANSPHAHSPSAPHRLVLTLGSRRLGRATFKEDGLAWARWDCSLCCLLSGGERSFTLGGTAIDMLSMVA